MPISHVTSLQGTTAVLPCDVASTSGWVGFAFDMIFVILLVFSFFLRAFCFWCFLLFPWFFIFFVFFAFWFYYPWFCFWFCYCLLCFLLLLLQADVFLILWFKDNATKPMYRWDEFFLPTYNHKTTIRYEEKKFCFHDVCNTTCSFMFQVWAASSLPSSILCGGWLSLIWSLVNNWFTLYIRWAVPRRETPQKTLTF